MHCFCVFLLNLFWGLLIHPKALSGMWRHCGLKRVCVSVCVCRGQVLAGLGLWGQSWTNSLACIDSLWCCALFIMCQQQETQTPGQVLRAWDAVMHNTMFTISITVHMKAKMVMCTPVANTCIRLEPGSSYPITRNSITTLSLKGIPHRQQCSQSLHPASFQQQFHSEGFEHWEKLVRTPLKRPLCRYPSICSLWSSDHSLPKDIHLQLPLFYDSALSTKN